MLISVIVPVYNTAQYLPICIESILNQTYKNIEIILIDDGSEDESLKICKEYSKKDSRIRVVANKHQGLVSARKSGVKEASGEYCIFVDSDDWIASELLEEVFPLTEGGTTDIVNFSLQNVDGEKRTDWKYTISEGIYEKKELENIYSRMVFDFEEGSPGIIQSLCSKLMKKDILLLSMSTMDENITLGEDAAIVYKAMLLSEKIAVINRCFYYYRVRENSMYHSYDSDVFNKVCCFQQYMKKMFEDYDKSYRLEEQLRYYLMSFIKKGVEDIYGIKLLNLYRLPFEREELKGRIVLYGAGSVGKSYYRQLSREEGIKIVAWIDKGMKGQKIYGYMIEAPEILKNIEFNNVVIAVKEQGMADEIKKQLSLQVPEEQILWKYPRINWWEREITI